MDFVYLFPAFLNLCFFQRLDVTSSLEQDWRSKNWSEVSCELRREREEAEAAGGWGEEAGRAAVG